MDQPPCFPADDDWSGWQRLARRAPKIRERSNVCVDCLPDYQAEMVACGLCTYPKTRFALVRSADETELVGLRPAHRTGRPRKSGDGHNEPSVLQL